MGYFIPATAGGQGARYDLQGRRRLGTTTAPTVTVGAAAGTGAAAATVAGTDEFGIVSVTMGTSPTTGVLATVTFAVAYDAVPSIVILQDQDGKATSITYTVTATQLVISVGAAITGNTKINYMVVGPA